MCGQVGRAVRERVRAAIGVENRVDPDLPTKLDFNLFTTLPSYSPYLE